MWAGRIGVGIAVFQQGAAGILTELGGHATVAVPGGGRSGTGGTTLASAAILWAVAAAG